MFTCTYQLGWDNPEDHLERGLTLTTLLCSVSGVVLSCGRLWCCSCRVFVCDLFLFHTLLFTARDAA